MMFSFKTSCSHPSVAPDPLRVFAYELSARKGAGIAGGGEVEW